MAPAAHQLSPLDSAQGIFEERRYGESVNMGVVKLGGVGILTRKSPALWRG